VDPVKQGFDVALQIFAPASDELVARRMFPVRRVFCASPAYLKRHGTPRLPRELYGHRLGLYSGYPTRDRWVFHHEGAEPQTLELRPKLMSNSVHFLREWASEHAGIVCLPTFVAADWVCRGELKIVLADHLLSAFWLSAVYPRTQRGAFKLRLFIEALAGEFAGSDPPWDVPLIERGLMPARLIEA
jgi:DNA-binding transcriptional LysR family regulator